MIAIDSSETRELLTLMLHAARSAGDAIMAVYDSPDIGARMKTSGPVTEADKRANDRILTLLSQSTKYPTISEESDVEDWSVRRKWHRVWMVDPLDGTKEFISKNGEFTVNICLVENGQPILGVIHAPAVGKLYAGAVGHGVWKQTWDPQDVTAGAGSSSVEDASRLMPAECERPSVYTVVRSRSHSDAITFKFIRDREEEHSSVATIEAGSSLKFCLVADGAADVYPRFGRTMEWDTAAGHAIAEAADCEVVRLVDGTPLHYNKRELSNPGFVVRARLRR